MRDDNMALQCMYNFLQTLLLLLMLDLIFYRLRVYYLIKDDTGTASITFWDKQARQLINKTAVELINELPEV